MNRSQPSISTITPAWLQVLESIHHQRNEVIDEFELYVGKKNLFPGVETYDTLRLSTFTVMLFR